MVSQAWSGPTSSVTTAAWHHIAVTYDKSSAANDPTALIDGTVVTMTEQFAPSGTMTDDDIFNLVVGNTVGGGRTFNGNLDELRLSSTPRGTGWIQTQYQNQSDPGSFYTVSAPL